MSKINFNSLENLALINLDELRKEIKLIGIAEFMSFLFDKYSNLLAIEIALSSIKAWHTITYKDCKHVVEKLNYNALGLIHFISFIGKYIGVDLRVELHLVSVQTKAKVLDYLGTSASPLFYFDKRFDDTILERFEVTSEFLNQMKIHLVREGAFQAYSTPPIQYKLKKNSDHKGTLRRKS